MLKKEYKTAKSILNDFLIVTRENKMVFRGISKNDQLLPTIKRVGIDKLDLSKNEFVL